MVCLPADYESKVRRCRDTVCDCHARGYWDAVTFSPRDYAKLLFTGIVSYTSIYRGLCVGRSLTRCHLAVPISNRGWKPYCRPNRIGVSRFGGTVLSLVEGNFSGKISNESFIARVKHIGFLYNFFFLVCHESVLTIVELERIHVLVHFSLISGEFVLFWAKNLSTNKIRFENCEMIRSFEIPERYRRS